MNAMLSDYRVKRNILSYIQKSSGQIIVRVRWNKVEVSFFIGFYGEPEKWDLANKMALRGTIHEVNGKKYSGAEINKTLNAYLNAIDKVFRGFEVAGEMPSKEDVKTGVNRLLGRGKAIDEAEAERKKKTVLSRLGDFIKYAGKSNNWQEACYTKYNAIRENLKVFDPELTFEDLTYEKLTLLRDWYVCQNYRNRTINKNFAFIKGFLIWAGKQGYLVHKDTLEYRTNLKVVPKPVSFLSFSELMDFYRFSFPENRKSLERARDMFAFMCFTSLRISDLRNLRRSDLRNGKLYVVTQKTADPLVIDLNEYAREIIDKYSGEDLENNALLPVATGQKLNKYLQEGAELAGLNKEWTDVYYVGKERRTEVHRFFEIISCHDARRTFICCSLAMGIPADVVMRWTGHKDYDSMRPYIEVASTTKEEAMKKWNKAEADTKKELIDKIAELSPEELEKILFTLKKNR